MAWLSNAAISFDDGSFVSWGWLILVFVVWTLIPGALLLRKVLDAEHKRVMEETQPAIDEGIRNLRQRITLPERVVAEMMFDCSICWSSFTLRPTPYVSVICPYCSNTVLLTPLPDELDYEFPPPPKDPE